MEKGIFTNEENGDLTRKDGRDVIWLQQPATTGGKYSSVCTCIFKPGGRALPGHAHANGEETVYVISGTGKVKIGEDIFNIKPGSLFLFPQGVPHMVWNNSETEDLHIVCFYANGQEAIAYEDHPEFDFPEFQK